MSKPYNMLLIFLLCLVTLAVLGQKKHPLPGDTPAVAPRTTGDRIIVTQEPVVETLDPAMAADTGSARVIANIFEGLVRFKPGSVTVEPCLAESWSVSEDGLVWTFNLRRNVSFHDGTPFDSTAVKFSVERQLTQSHGKKTSYADFVYTPLAKVETAGRHTVKFHLKYPYAPFLHNLAMPMAAPVVSPTAVRKYGRDFGDHPVGTGPFAWVGVKEGGIMLRAHEDYWGHPPTAKEILFLTIPDSEQRVQMLLDGKSDIALDLAFNSTARLRIKGYPVFRATGLDISYLGFYTDRKPFDRPAVRRAVALALNKEAVFNRLWPQEIRPALGPLPPPVPGYNAGLTQAGYAPREAARLLQAAGYEKGFSFTLITYAGARPYSPGGGKALAEALARSLAEQGINMQVRSYPWDKFKKALAERQGDAFLYGWISDNGDPDDFLYTLLATSQIKNGLNITRYQNAELDTLLAAGRNTTDPRTRREIYSRAQEIINRDVPWIVLNHSLHYAATTPRVRGFLLNPDNRPFLHMVTKN
ncbi:ABC transporter substrate-binding protein [Desulfoscipio geothermicus]|uniref:Peptide/nickel transport system substrate-binding protein n=1 Tax=Desulfoscipio geothermicus DSM 3669 TaxID=1121426 RepID=A0A1I6CRS7_9FIRM|nr:ABC transporter substrate-binding protein [Desulfoscipio geothermicus]SFQ95888.1 peptide/nickel transport system substrate-binding protein [Desulfoscipio geothermicus DSM 3669]